MKLAFSGKARYPEFDRGYELYVHRSRSRECVDKAKYKRIVKEYCRILADRICEEGMIDLPSGLGSISAAVITRKPQYRGKKFIGYGKMDWEKGHYDGVLKTFGIVFLPNRQKKGNLRCFGFVANRQLFRKVKERFLTFDRRWSPIDFNDEMI